MTNNQTTEMSFETALARLEQIVHTLEEGSGDLDAALKAFEEGIALVRLCSEKLEGAEQRVKLLLADANGVSAVPFEG
ncbi:MAG: exodeoxyribonuclease VII small subunit [Clostridia bacterium]|nr:exodeoxyribonuclease VII small subunit [Clostridia bacterium]